MALDYKFYQNLQRRILLAEGGTEDDVRALEEERLRRFKQQNIDSLAQQRQRVAEQYPDRRVVQPVKGETTRQTISRGIGERQQEKGLLDRAVNDVANTVSNVAGNIPLIGTRRQSAFGGNVAQKIEALKKRPDYAQISELAKGQSPSVQAKIINLASEGKGIDEIRRATAEASTKLSQENKRLAGDIAEVGSFVIPGGAGIRAAMGAKDIVRPVATSTLSGAVGGAGYELSQDPSQSVLSAVTSPSTLIGAGAGAAIPLVGAAIGAARRPKLDAPFRTGVQVVDSTLDAPASDVAQRQIQKYLQERTKYKQGTLRKATDTLRREIADPLNRLVREDRAYSKLSGVSREQLVRDGRSLPELALNARFNGEIVKQFTAKKRSNGLSLNDVIQKYGEDTPEGQQFVNYLNNKFTLEVFDKSKGKKNIQPGFNIDELRDSVNKYENINGQAIKDARTLKEHADDLIDYAVDARVIAKDDAKFVKNYYKNYTPLSRVFSEDLVRPTVTGGISTNVGKQRILQSLEGSDLPLDLSFGTAINRTNLAVGQALKNRLDTEILRRQQEGLFSGRLVIDAELTKAGKELRELHKGLVEKGQTIRTQLGKNVSRMRVQNAYTAPIRKKAVTATRNYLQKGIADPDAQAALNSMTDRQLMDTFQVLTGDKEIEAIRGQLIKKGTPGQRLLDDIDNLKSEYVKTDAQRQKSFEELVNVKQDKTTGMNVITGQLDGEKFAIEAAPDFIDALAYLNKTQQRDLISSAAKAGADVQKSLFTGVFAPVFQAIQVVKNQGIMFTNARRLSPYGARAIAESIRPDPAFVRELVARGARPELFTQSVNDATQTALQIASKGSMKGKVKLIKSNTPLAAKDFFRNLNRFGGFLGNRQRLQIARGAYQNAINRGIPKDEALNIAAQAHNEVLGNFNRVSNLARNMEPVILYSGAIQAGLRPIFTAFKNRPVETSAKFAGLATALGGFASASLGSQAGQDYYTDMYENGQAYNIDNFITYVAPWASKDIETGKWSGIYRVPIAPDFRPLNKAVADNIYKMSTGQGGDPVTIAQGLFNFVTGGIAQVTDYSGISSGEIVKNNPFVRTLATSLGKDLDTGAGPTGLSNVQDLPEGRIGKELLSQTGLTGKVATKGPGAVVSSFTNQFSAPFGTQKEVGKRLTSAITDRPKISDKITEALQKENYNEANRLASEYNNRLQELRSFVEDKKTRKLTDKQKALLDRLSFPVEDNQLKQSSIDARLRQ